MGQPLWGWAIYTLGDIQISLLSSSSTSSTELLLGLHPAVAGFHGHSCYLCHLPKMSTETRDSPKRQSAHLHASKMLTHPTTFITKGLEEDICSHPGARAMLTALPLVSA